MSTDNVTYTSADAQPETDGPDAYAGSYDTTEGRVYTVAGGDWDTVTGVAEGEHDRIVAETIQLTEIALLFYVFARDTFNAV